MKYMDVQRNLWSPLFRLNEVDKLAAIVDRTSLKRCEKGFRHIRRAARS